MENFVGLVIAVVVIGFAVYKMKPEWVEPIIAKFKKKQQMGKLLGSEDKPMKVRSSPFTGKGSRQRPGDHKKYMENYDKIFGKKVSTADKVEEA